MIEKNMATKAFMDYAAGYDTSDILISSKIAHTMKVASYAERIAESIALTKEEKAYAWLLGLLHDFGRFEQVKRYGTFSDIQSVDHAELGADILFKEGKIELFIEAGLDREDLKLTETAIRQHNKLKLPDDIDDRTRTFCDLLRDADKIDIFRMVDEIPLDKRAGTSRDSLMDKEEASEEVMEYVKNHSCIPRDIIESGFELHISHICMAFEIVYEESRRMILEQGYLKHLLALKDDKGEGLWNEKESRQLKCTEEELGKAWQTVI